MKKKSSFDNGLRLWHPNTTPGTSLGCATLHIIYWKENIDIPESAIFFEWVGSLEKNIKYVSIIIRNRYEKQNN